MCIKFRSLVFWAQLRIKRVFIWHQYKLRDIYVLYLFPEENKVRLIIGWRTRTMKTRQRVAEGSSPLFMFCHTSQQENDWPSPYLPSVWHSRCYISFMEESSHMSPGVQWQKFWHELEQAWVLGKCILFLYFLVPFAHLWSTKVYVNHPCYHIISCYECLTSLVAKIDTCSAQNDLDSFDHGSRKPDRGFSSH